MPCAVRSIIAFLSVTHTYIYAHGVTHTYIYAHGVAGPFVASHKRAGHAIYIIMYVSRLGMQLYCVLLVAFGRVRHERAVVNLGRS